MNVITLVKTETDEHLPVGWTYPWTYKSVDYAQALSRAWRALKRDHPRENPMRWKLQDAKAEVTADA